MDIAQNFTPIGQPIGYVGDDGQVYGNDATIRLLLSLFNRTGQEPGVDAVDSELLAFYQFARPPAVNPRAIATEGAFGGLLLDRPPRLPDLTDAFMFALIMLGARVTAQGSASGSASGATASLVASETITAPALVNVWNNSGAFNVRNADGSTTGKDCHGFAAKSITSGQTGLISFGGTMAGLSGLTAGYAYLGASGAVTSSSETVSGDTAQRVGIAVSATSIIFAPQTSFGL